uniref:RING-type E3 ubiquitin transferase n=1 Tax=Kalanchoe fedtschenkoi TaxID=63787 RepID=A0A7N0UH97_KALFE
MAKPGASEADPAGRLYKELRKLVEAIVGADDGVDAVDKARDVLCAIRDLRTRRMQRSSSETDMSVRVRPESASVPDEFKCPLSTEIMKDPVVVSTGQTYDRASIQNWLKAGHRTCPRTQQVLSHAFLTPNLMVRDLIEKWCRSNGVMESLETSKRPDNGAGANGADREHFVNLLRKMSCSSANSQKEAAKELRLLTKRLPSFRALFGESLDSIPQLVSPLCPKNPGDSRSIHPDLQEDVITTVLNLSIHDSNKKLVAETPKVMSVLLDALQSGTIETRSNAAAALFTLSALDSNKVLIGKSGALEYLINLIEEGEPLAMKDAASAIFNLCILHDNRAIAVRDGAIRVILKQIMNRVHVDELVAILAMLASHPKVAEEMEDLGGVPCLLDIIRESPCNHNKENCIAILHTVCLSDRSLWRELKEEENARATISHLAQSGTSRAKRKANSILSRMNRTVNITHTA